MRPGPGTFNLSARDRLLPGLGARLGSHPRVAAALLVLLRQLPAARARDAAFRHVSRPLLERMRASLDVPVSGGSRMKVDTSEVIGRMLAISGTWEPHVTNVFRGLLAPGDVCVDVGASIGYYTLLASKLVGPTGHVYALEPAPKAYAALCSNLELNRVTNVTPLRIAAGAKEGRAPLFDGPLGNTGQSSLRGLPDGPAPHDAGLTPTATVQVRPVASLVPESEIDRIKLVKIDVEGYEAEVFRGLDLVFDAGLRPAVLVELHLRLLTEEDLGFISGFCGKYGLSPVRLVDEHRPAGSSEPIRLPFDSSSLPGRQDLLLTPD